jgi:hypothetical protein
MRPKFRLFFTQPKFRLFEVRTALVQIVLFHCVLPISVSYRFNVGLAAAKYAIVLECLTVDQLSQDVST